MLRVLKPTLSCLLILVLAGCGKSSEKAEDLVNFVPENSSLVVRIADLGTAKAEILSNGLFKQLNQSMLYEYFDSNKELISHLNPKGETILSIANETDSLPIYTLVTPAHADLFNKDSIPGLMVDTAQYKKYIIENYRFNSTTNHSVQIDSIFVFSSSEEGLHKLIDNKPVQDPTFTKAFGLKSNEELVGLIQPNSLKINDSLEVNFATQAALRQRLFTDGMAANGVILDTDSLQLIRVFRGILPQVNQAAQVIPVSAIQARIISYQDTQRLQQNLGIYHDKKIELHSLLGSFNELGSLQLKNGKAIVARSIDPDITQEELALITASGEEFREVVIRNFPEERPDFYHFYPLIETLEANYVFQWENFFIFSETEEVAKELITSLKNKATLANARFFQEAQGQLSQSSSFVIYDLNGRLSSWTTAFMNAQPTQMQNFPLAALQFSYDRDFAHVNLVCRETSQSQLNPGIVGQLFIKSLDRELLNGPFFFSNYKTKGQDIVVQDVSNELYLISSKGKTIWKQRLDGPVLGKIHEVDILRNGKKQLAFTTDKTFYVLDRNGNNVAPFPKKYKDDITQPLSVFDYDNRRKYRFVVTQGKEVHMYDNQGKAVTGFKFEATSSPIVLPPQHIRMGNKDYLVIAEQNGKLNILSRVGKTRVSVNRTFDFSEIPIAEEGTNFVVITRDGEKKSITQTGKVSSQKINASDNYWFEIKGSTKITLDDNLLRINGKLVELPFGIYSKPQLFNINRQSYITVTDTQEKLVYVYDKTGVLLQGFPVYGASSADIASDLRKKLLTVATGDKEIGLYTFD